MVNIDRILCAVDFSEFSLDALRHAVVLADWYSAQLRLFHAEPLPQTMLGGGVPESVPVIPVEFDPAETTEEIRKFCAPVLGESGVEAEIVVRAGDAAREIRAEAEGWPADLLIMGTHGRTGFERLFLGSVTEKVLRSTRVPVLTIPPPVREPGSPLFKTILCPMDFSEASLRALEYALSLAQEADARLILLHVIEHVLGEAGARALGHLNVAEYYRHLEEDAITRLKAVVPDDARVWARPDERVVRGVAYDEILKVAAGEGVELVVMGVQGRGALSQFVFGSTTHRVIREARCPVLTLHGGPSR
ncbi:MAG TPA: universal stress protein [Vicinamibacterales bacterium]